MNAFDSSPLNSIVIPSNLADLKEGWCEKTLNLEKIEVSNENPIYKSYDKFILGKSSVDKQEYDVLIFAERDIKNATIPSFIKIIGPYAFNFCMNLEKVKIAEDSKLEVIEKYAFSESSIKKIKIPCDLKRICRSAFYNCKLLRKVNIMSFSDLEVIENDAFFSTLIESLTFPSKFVDLDERWLCNMTKIREITFARRNPYYKSCDKFVLGKSSADK